MERTTSPLKGIRAHCLQCSGSAHEVKLCPIEDCPLYPFRFGRNPFTKRTYTEEQRRAVAERFAEARAAKSRKEASG